VPGRCIGDYDATEVEWRRRGPLGADSSLSDCRKRSADDVEVSSDEPDAQPAGFAVAYRR
jgi:hypothetical protein